MTRTQRLTLLAAAGAAALLTAWEASAQTYSRVVVFGDSLQDNGNLFAATRGTNPPSPPYFQGRFSNGPTFIEIVFPNQARFGTGVVTGNVNNAFGGARTDNQANPPSLPIQLAGYRAAGGTFGAADVVSILGGANNILQGVPVAAANPATAQTVVGGIATAAAADIGNLSRTIAGLGAGTLLVGNLPNIGTTPALAGPAAPLGTFATDTFNGALLAQLQATAAASPNTNVILADYNRASEFVRLNPTAFGFNNVTTPCLNATTGAVCATPDTFFFWDSVHPTAAGHRLLAAVATDYLYYGRLSAPTAVQAETALEHRRRAFDASLDAARSTPLAARDSRVSLTADYGETDIDARGDVPDSELETIGLRFAAEAGLTGDMTGGIAIAYTQSDVQAGPLGFEVMSYSADAWVGLRRDAFFVDAQVGGSFEEYDDIERRTSLAGAVHTADTVGYTVGAAVRAGVLYEFGGGVISPRVGLDYITTDVDGYSEDGPIARQDLGDRRIDALAAQATLRYETSVLQGVNAFVEGGYRDYLTYDADDVDAGLVSNPARRLLTEVDEPDDGLGLVNAGVSGAIAERWTISATYRGRFGDSYESNTGRIGVRLAF